MKEKLKVNHLSVSFRTSAGEVKAVRDLSFELNPGETLAIVGESGSGKSVTSKAILGLLSPNARVNSGEIIYDGRDILKLTERELYDIRGDRIAMIFQDPMSSLNPIVKIGRQLTEAAMLKSSRRAREARKRFNAYLRTLCRLMTDGNEDVSVDNITRMCRDFRGYAYANCSDVPGRVKLSSRFDMDAFQKCVATALENTVFLPTEKRKSAVLLIYEKINKSLRDEKEETEQKYENAAGRLIDYMLSLAKDASTKLTRGMAKERALKLMEEVGISDVGARFNQYPFELSGGMRQRIVIAIALAQNPDILICDEPTTALDVTIQSQILELINRFKRERGLSIIFITHDLGVVANMADRIAVMYAGKIVEYGSCEDIFYDPRHPYTWALLSSMPDLNTKEKLDAIPGSPPNMIHPPLGDAFAARNKYAMRIDFEKEPPMYEISPTHRAATWLLHPSAPRVEVPKIIRMRAKEMKKMWGGDENES